MASTRILKARIERLEVEELSIGIEYWKWKNNVILGPGKITHSEKLHTGKITNHSEDCEFCIKQLMKKHYHIAELNVVFDDLKMAYECPSKEIIGSYEILWS